LDAESSRPPPPTSPHSLPFFLNYFAVLKEEKVPLGFLLSCSSSLPFQFASFPPALLAALPQPFSVKTILPLNTRTPLCFPWFVLLAFPPFPLPGLPYIFLKPTLTSSRVHFDSSPPLSSQLSPRPGLEGTWRSCLILSFDAHVTRYFRLPFLTRSQPVYTIHDCLAWFKEPNSLC